MAKLNENDKELVQEMSKIENDDTLMQFTKAQLQELWKTVADQSAIRSVQKLRKTVGDQSAISPVQKLRKTVADQSAIRSVQELRKTVADQSTIRSVLLVY